MRSIVGPVSWVVVLAVAAALLAACGGDQEQAGERSREAMPFRLIRLKNASPPEGRPATARAVGSKMGKPGPIHEVGPVPPGVEQPSEPPGEEASDAVTIEVTFENGPTFQGNGEWPGSFISEVAIECAEPEGGQATVMFATGQPPEIIPLLP